MRLSKTAIAAGWIGAMSVVSAASGATYNYVGQPQPEFGNYIKATVELSCAITCAAGDYFETAGIVSWSLSAYSSTNDLLATVNHTTVPVLAYSSVIFLRLDTEGVVTNWSLFRFGETAGIVTNGFSPPFSGQEGDPIRNSELAVLFGGELLLSWNADGSINPPLGAWTRFDIPNDGTSPVPLPGAMILFGTVLAGGGLFAWRRKRRDVRRAPDARQTA